MELRSKGQYIYRRQNYKFPERCHEFEYANTPSWHGAQGKLYLYLALYVS
jgi:hypothetical protein